MSRLTQRYAAAAFQVALGQDALDLVAQDLGKLATAFADRGLRLMVLSPQTSNLRRRELMEQILTGSHACSKNLVGVILDRRRQAILPELSQAYQSLLREHRGEAIGVLETAKPLDASTQATLSATASDLVGKKVTLKVIDNPDLIGGVRIRVGNTLFDGSVATVLQELEQALMSAPLS